MPRAAGDVAGVTREGKGREGKNLSGEMEREEGREDEDETVQGRVA